MTNFRGRALRLGAAAAVFAVISAPGMAQNAGPDNNGRAELMADMKNSYIFIFNDGVRGSAVSARAYGLASRHNGTVGHVYSTAIRGFSAKMSAQAAARMVARNPEIAYYEADSLVEAVGGKNGGARVEAAAKPVVDNSGPRIDPKLTGIGRVGGPVDGTGLTAWVLDTGIDLDHPDLIVDVERSRKFAGGRNANDDNGHGTHVAGIIGALDNEFDVVGVAAGATLVSVRVLRRNMGGRTSGVIAGVDYVAATAQPGDVANMSLTTIGGPSPALDAAVISAADRGILFAVAAGNEGAHANNISPSRVEHKNVFTVSAVDEFDNFAWFSNWGNPPIDFAAPGVDVVSSAIDGGTATMSGTSMAAPHMAGVLLVNNGSPDFDGCAIGDPDGNPDRIVHIAGSGSC